MSNYPPPQDPYGAYNPEQNPQWRGTTDQPQQPGGTGYGPNPNPYYNPPGGYQQPYQGQAQMGYPPPGYGYQPPGNVYQQYIYPGQPPVFMQQLPDSRKGMAIAGFVLGLISFLPSFYLGFGLIFSIPGLIFSSLGMRSTTSRGLAIAGMVLSIISLCIGAFILLIFVILYHSYRY